MAPRARKTHGQAVGRGGNRPAKASFPMSPGPDAAAVHEPRKWELGACDRVRGRRRCRRVYLSDRGSRRKCNRNSESNHECRQGEFRTHDAASYLRLFHPRAPHMGSRCNDSNPYGNLTRRQERLAFARFPHALLRGRPKKHPSSKTRTGTKPASTTSPRGNNSTKDLLNRPEPAPEGGVIPLLPNRAGSNFSLLCILLLDLAFL
jgi:hypothetical protein